MNTTRKASIHNFNTSEQIWRTSATPRCRETFLCGFNNYLVYNATEQEASVHRKKRGSKIAQLCHTKTAVHAGVQKIVNNGTVCQTPAMLEWHALELARRSITAVADDVSSDD